MKNLHDVGQIDKLEILRWWFNKNKTARTTEIKVVNGSYYYKRPYPPVWKPIRWSKDDESWAYVTRLYIEESSRNSR